MLARFVLPCLVLLAVVAAPSAAEAQAPSPVIIVEQPSAPAPYVETQPAPSSEYVVDPGTGYAPAPQPITRSRPRWGMIGAGIGLLAGGWIINLLVGAIGIIVFEDRSTAEADAQLYFGMSAVPLVGSIVNAGMAAHHDFDGLLVPNVLFAVLQAAGIALIAIGAVATEEYIEYSLGDSPDAPRLAVLPWASAQGAGGSLSLSF